MREVECYTKTGELGGANVGQTHNWVPCRAKIQVEPFLREALKECRYGSAFNARVWSPFLEALANFPDIFMWVTSRTPEELLLGGGGNAAFSCAQRWVGTIEGWSQTGLEIGANYLHMCCPGRNITDPPSALCVKRLESGYCCFIQSNEDKRRTERRGGRGEATSKTIYCVVLFFKSKTASQCWKECLEHLLNLSIYWSLLARGALAFTSNSFVQFLGFKASLVFVFLKFLVFSVLFALFRTLCTSMIGPQLYFCKPKDQRKKKKLSKFLCDCCHQSTQLLFFTRSVL